MIAVGCRLRRLGTDELTWNDLRAVVKWAAPGGALHRALDPDGSGWTVDSYLLAAVGDALNAANWQRAGDKHLKRPEPIPRPGMKQKPKRTNLVDAVIAARKAGNG